MKRKCNGRGGSGLQLPRALCLHTHWTSDFITCFVGKAHQPGGSTEHIHVTSFSSYRPSSCYWEKKNEAGWSSHPAGTSGLCCHDGDEHIVLPGLRECLGSLDVKRTRVSMPKENRPLTRNLGTPSSEDASCGSPLQSIQLLRATARKKERGYSELWTSMLTGSQARWLPVQVNAWRNGVWCHPLHQLTPQQAVLHAGQGPLTNTATAH